MAQIPRSTKRILVFYQNGSSHYYAVLLKAIPMTLSFFSSTQRKYPERGAVAPREGAVKDQYCDNNGNFWRFCCLCEIAQNCEKIITLADQGQPRSMI